MEGEKGTDLMCLETCADIDRIQIGDAARCTFVATEADIDAFAQFSSDDNALHVDEDFARRRGFPARVAHGMVALSAISRLIGTQLPGHGSLWVSQELQFVQPVLADSELAAEVRVTAMSRAAQLVVLETTVTNVATAAPVLRGTAKVRIPREQLER
jgi:acyl dehydratase